jgi:hypothetical protein
MLNTKSPFSVTVRIIYKVVSDVSSNIFHVDCTKIVNSFVNYTVETIVPLSRVYTVIIIIITCIYNLLILSVHSIFHS